MEGKNWRNAVWGVGRGKYDGRVGTFSFLCAFGGDMICSGGV